MEIPIITFWIRVTNELKCTWTTRKGSTKYKWKRRLYLNISPYL